MINTNHNFCFHANNKFAPSELEPNLASKEIPKTPPPQNSPHFSSRTKRNRQKPNLSKAPEHRNFRNKRSHALPRDRNLLPSALQSETLGQGKATNNYAESAPSNGAAEKLTAIRRCNRGNEGFRKRRRGRANFRRVRLAGGRSLVWREKNGQRNNRGVF
ncbi:hypothetical protein ACSQ67_019414 [Phaseolus vulgaris]